MKIYLAADHTGFALKEKVKTFLAEVGYEVEDCGAVEYDKNDDYPDFISVAAKKVSSDPNNSKAVIFGSTGEGEAMVANKFKNVRAAVFYTPFVPVHNVDVSGRVSQDPYEIVKLTRDHNDANVLSIGAKMLKEEEALMAIKIWLETPFSNEERHLRRIKKISEIENDRDNSSDPNG